MSPATIENRSDLPSEVVGKVVRWTLRQLKIHDVSLLIIRVERTQKKPHHDGIIYLDPPWLPGIKFVISAKVPMRFPYWYLSPLQKGPPTLEIENWEESLVCILAHEGMHLVQHLHSLITPQKKGYWQTRKGKQVHINAKVFDEVQADWSEHTMLQRYRERGDT